MNFKNGLSSSHLCSQSVSDFSRALPPATKALVRCLCPSLNVETVGLNWGFKNFEGFTSPVNIQSYAESKPSFELSATIEKQIDEQLRTSMAKELAEPIKNALVDVFGKKVCLSDDEDGDQPSASEIIEETSIDSISGSNFEPSAAIIQQVTDQFFESERTHFLSISADLNEKMNDLKKRLERLSIIEQINTPTPIAESSAELMSWLARWNICKEEVVFTNRYLYVTCERLGNMVLGYVVKTSLEKRFEEDEGVVISGGQYNSLTQAVNFANVMIDMDDRWSD